MDMAIKWIDSGERKHVDLNKPPENYPVKSSEFYMKERSPEYAEFKQYHVYRGFTFHKHQEYNNFWGPALDKEGNTVDGLEGLFNDFNSLERAVDSYLAQKAIMEQKKADLIAKHRAPPAEEPSPIVEETIEASSPTISYTSTPVDAKEALRDRR